MFNVGKKNVVSIYTEMTPNPETMKFVANKLLYAGKSIDFPEGEDTAPSPLAQELFEFPFVKGVFIASNFVTITKDPAKQWEDITSEIRMFLREYLEAEKQIINEDLVEEKEDNNMVLSDDPDVIKRIKEMLENYVKPAVEMDGGAISFVSFDEDKGVVTLLLQGSCSGCPSARITLKAGIEQMMMRMIPEVKEVIAEEELY